MAEVAFHDEMQVSGSPADVQRAWQEWFTGWMGQGKYLPREQTPASVTYQRTFVKGWVIVCCVIFFPIGLLFLLAPRGESRVNVQFVSQGEGTTAVQITGSMAPKHRAQFEARIKEFGGGGAEAPSPPGDSPAAGQPQ